MQSMSPTQRFLARAGLASFAFFFLKGLAWVAVFIIAAVKIAEQ
jgi:hypothetical protein